MGMRGRSMWMKIDEIIYWFTVLLFHIHCMRCRLIVEERTTVLLREIWPQLSFKSRTSCNGQKNASY